MSVMSSVEEMEATRTARAQEEDMTYMIVGDNDHIMQGSNGNNYILDVDGTSAVSCTCPDHQQRDVRCKHMAAYEDWEVDEVKLSSGTEVQL